MRSYPKCILPVFLVPSTPSSSSPPDEPWNELSAYRETFLRHFTRPEDRAALVRHGELLMESALEQAHLWPPLAGPEMASGVAAALRDFHHLCHFLTSLGDARHLSALLQPEHALALGASRTVRRIRPELRHLVDDLERCQGELARWVN